MRTKYFVILPIVIIFNACIQQSLESLEPTQKPREGINIKISDAYIFYNDDIEYYDQSSHLFYMKNNISDSVDDYFETNYWITNGNNVLLSGLFDYYNSCTYLCFREPEMKLTITRKTGAPYLLMLDYKPGYDTLYFDNADIRNDQNFLNNLSERGKLRAGLSCEIDDVTVMGLNQVSVTLKITNADNVNYYIPDPEKMPVEYYHSFTNGLILVNTESNTVSDFGLYPEDIDSFSDFKKEWFSLIETGSEKFLTIQYNDFDDVHPGDYKAFFRVPGIWNGIVPNKDDLNLGNGRIWLGFSEVSRYCSFS